MGDFFHGWRRKMGMVTLLMSCVVAGGWVRSRLVEDDISITFREDGYHLRSKKGEISLWYYKPQLLGSIGQEWKTKKVDDDESETQLISSSDLDSRDYFAGRTDVRHMGIASVLITTPLTMLSAYLLLSNPRPKTTPAKSP